VAPLRSAWTRGCGFRWWGRRKRFNRRLFFNKALADIFALEICQAGSQQLAVTLNILVVSSQQGKVFLKHLVLQQTFQNGGKTRKTAVGCMSIPCRVKQKWGQYLIQMLNGYGLMHQSAFLKRHYSATQLNPRDRTLSR
jgi:hypothetical protein